jgi:CRISPR-associated protein Cas1
LCAEQVSSGVGHRLGRVCGGAASPGRSLGCSPGLGFVCSGHERSFVLEVADPYKTEIAIPAAFDAAAEGDEDVPTRTRRALRERINKSRLLERCTADIKKLLRYGEFAADGAGEDEDRAGLQTDGDRVLDGGRTYGDEPIW